MTHQKEKDILFTCGKSLRMTESVITWRLLGVKMLNYLTRSLLLLAKLRKLFVSCFICLFFFFFYRITVDLIGIFLTSRLLSCPILHYNKVSSKGFFQIELLTISLSCQTTTPQLWPHVPVCFLMTRVNIFSFP